MIVMGYPGVGKSTYASNHRGVIDLESSWFHGIFEIYVDVALKLSRAGNLVFISCHNDVYKWLMKKKKDMDRVCVLFPNLSLKSKWVDKLQERWECTKSRKDERAYMRAAFEYEPDVLTILNGYDESIQRYVIDSMRYEFSYDFDTEKFELNNLHVRKYSTKEDKDEN